MRTKSLVAIICSLYAALAAQAGTMTYTYDAQNRLVAARSATNVTTFGYDAGGNLTGSAYPGMVQLGGGDRPTYEGIGSVSFTVTRANGSEGPLSLAFATANSSAAAPQDYTAANGTLIWADGETGAKTFQVAVLPDAFNEWYGETFQVNLLTPQPAGVLLSPNSAMVTIYDRAIDIWRVQQFGTAYNNGLTADLGDYDADGLSNLLEYAFGQDPKSKASRAVPAGSLGTLAFSIGFAEPVGVNGITYGAEWSPSLLPGSWQPLSDLGTGGQHFFSLPLGGNERGFMRLNVTSP